MSKKSLCTKDYCIHSIECFNCRNLNLICHAIVYNDKYCTVYF